MENEKRERSILRRITGEVFEWMESVVFALVIVVLIFTFMFRIVRVDGSSMYPTLQNNDKVIVSNVLYKPRQGDIIVTTQENMFGEPLIKRIIATEGQQIDIQKGSDDSTGLVYVEGQLCAEAYAYYDTTRSFYTGDAYEYPITVPKGKAFCMGDNRNNSSDSRSSYVKMIDVDSILGKAQIRIFPLGSFGGIY
ncbi:MAG: signal peptidase I [Oscillospiraceae bacterium]|jgi:signal peptidase I|nr:signal peptidase I [Oscillospiraceae bacterium]